MLSVGSIFVFLEITKSLKTTKHGAAFFATVKLRTDFWLQPILINPHGRGGHNKA
jgi:hypothetical protein